MPFVQANIVPTNVSSCKPVCRSNICSKNLFSQVIFILVMFDLVDYGIKAVGPSACPSKHTRPSNVFPSKYICLKQC